MRYLSLFSGIEAASAAWHDLGWTPVGFSEIEPFPCAVLAHRFPNVRNYGDVTKYKEWDIKPGSVDVVVGGSPCQAFSVAGLRKGLDDPRGNLTLTYLGVVAHLRPRWVVWENVPGVLSIDGGRVLGAFLGALGQLGYRWAYRVLDAQHFGVPQRRRRIFAVASLGNRTDPAEVLFERESLCGGPAPRRKTRKGSASVVGEGTGRSGGRIDCTPAGITGALSRKWSKGTGGPAGDEHYNLICATGSVTHALTRSQKGATEDGTGRGTPIVPVAQATQVRRLTPLECERLQGFPDGWTDIPYRGKLAADGPRYKALGNSMAVPVMRWIGQRIQLIGGGS